MSDHHNKEKTTSELLLEAEALLHFLISSNAANDPDSEVVVESLAASAKLKISEALQTLPE